MIETFDSLGNQALFAATGGVAGGISQALLTTQMGLVVAIPRHRRAYTRPSPTPNRGRLRPAHSRSDFHERRADMLMSRRRRQTDEAGVDISPLIDMVFILLIFFMVTTTFVKDAQVELDRPSASSAKAASTKAIRVTLDRRGDTYVSGRAVRPWLLQGTVREMLRGSKDRPVLVITDAGVKAQALLTVIDQCRLAGAKDVAVATEKEAI